MPDHEVRRLSGGKLPAALLGRLLAGLDASPEVRLGPRVGEDACVIDIPAGALVAAADPITLTGAGVGRYAVLVNANDIAVMGVQPRWFLATVLLPIGTVEDDVVALFAEMTGALREVGAALVGGHTEVTAAVTQPLISGQMLGLAEDGRVLTTAGAALGDAVVQIGPVPVEGAAVLADAFGERLPADVRDAAAKASTDPGISVVAAALAAADLGATAMHDPTEGGLAAGLHEVADAAGLALRINRDRIEWFGPGQAVCAALGADPWATLASGCVIATFPAQHADAAVAGLRDRGFATAIVGTTERGSGVRDTEDVALPWPDRDEVARLLDG